MKPEELREGYVGWCPHIDYMQENKKYPDAWDNVKTMTAEEFIKSWLPLDPDYNQIVDFYFLRTTPEKECSQCKGTGYNKRTKRLYDEWYGIPGGPVGWQKNLIQEEVDALWKKGRLREFHQKPTAEEVNRVFGEGFGHDTLNHHICVEVRAKRLGFWGLCETCKGGGWIATGKEYLGLNLWMTHPRKGAAKGIEITHVEEKHLPIFYSLLWYMGERLIERFKNLPLPHQASAWKEKLFKEGFPDIAGAIFNPR